jgi:calcineurin-like phosphoesterase
VIGFEVAAVHHLFLTQLPTRLPVEENARCLVLNSVLVEIDDRSRRATSIQRIDREHMKNGV